MNFLKDTYETYGTDVSGRLNIIGFVINDGTGNYPDADEFSGFHLLIGTKLLNVITGEIFYFDGSLTWYRKRTSMFENVYTKDDINKMIINASKNLMPINTASATATSGYALQNSPLKLPAGDYVLTVRRIDPTTSTAINIRDANNNSLWNVNRGAGVINIVEQFTLPSPSDNISIYVGYNVMIYDLMICSDTDYQIDSSYYPYMLPALRTLIPYI